MISLSITVVAATIPTAMAEPAIAPAVLPAIVPEIDELSFEVCSFTDWENANPSAEMAVTRPVTHGVIPVSSLAVAENMQNNADKDADEKHADEPTDLLKDVRKLSDI